MLTSLCAESDIKSFLIGVILGDGCIPKRRPRTLKIWHSTKQEEYTKHKCKVLNQLLDKNCKVRYQSNKHYTGSIYNTCGFELTHPLIESVYKELYIDNIKRYTTNTLQQLSKEGLAYWFMDDGTTGCRIHKERGRTTPSSVYLEYCTYCTEEEALLIKDYFESVWDIYPKIRRANKSTKPEAQYNVNFNTAESRKLTKLIKPYIIPSMEYKLRYMEKWRN